MIPIFEQGNGNGIGHSFDSFLRRFSDICEKSKSENIRKTFAFILYNFNDENLKQILKNDGVFTKLDRLTGSYLDVFYLNSNDSEIFDNFNNIIIHSFDFYKELNLPALIFFDFFNRDIENVEIIEIEMENKYTGFQEISEILRKHIENENKIYKDKVTKKNGLKILSSFTKEIAMTVIAEKINEFLKTDLIK